MIKSRGTSKKFIKFLIIGGIAFFIDAGVLQGLVNFLNVDPYSARFISFTYAVIFTWLMNRKYTFSIIFSPSLQEFIKYLATQSIGLAINFTIYSLCILSINLAADYPILALIPATGLALIFNFLSMKKIVFKSDSISS